MKNTVFYYFSSSGGIGRKNIRNVYNLVSKLAMAEKELSKDDPLGVYAGEFSFPLFAFGISNGDTLYTASKKLLEITDPIFPVDVESNKEGYEAIHNLLQTQYNGSLKSNWMRGGRKIVIPGFTP